MKESQSQKAKSKALGTCEVLVTILAAQILNFIISFDAVSSFSLAESPSLLATDKSQYFAQPRPIIANTSLTLYVCWLTTTSILMSTVSISQDAQYCINTETKNYCVYGKRKM